MHFAAVVAVRARSFRTEVPQDDGGAVDSSELTHYPLFIECFAMRSGAKIKASETRMNAGVRAVAMLLLTLTAAVSVAGQESTLMLPVPARPAVCHQHGAKPLAPKPVSYRCCQSGHDSAILQAPLTTRLSSVHRVSTGASISAPVTVSSLSRLQCLTIASPDPPRTIPLRV
jgi:hypothetical protein